MKYFPAILLLLFLAACSSPQKILMRTWKIDNVDFLDTLNTLSQQQKMMVTQELTKNLKFTFMPDSLYQVIVEGGYSTFAGRVGRDISYFHMGIKLAAYLLFSQIILIE